jgi:two-component system, NarL family, sensor kinase
VTGQDLVALSGTLGHLHARIPTSSRKLRKSISQCQGVTDRCIREIRTLSYLLHPPMLDEAGLEDAIRHYVPGFAERTGIEGQLEVPPNIGRLPREEEMALFRVMQESLVNIHRHSGSFNATILLHRTPGRVLLEMSDQGRGIPGNGHGRGKAASFPGGVGIQSMCERMKQVRGQLDIESSASGTTVRAMVVAHDREQK